MNFWQNLTETFFKSLMIQRTPTTYQTPKPNNTTTTIFINWEFPNWGIPQWGIPHWGIPQWLGGRERPPAAYPTLSIILILLLVFLQMGIPQLEVMNGRPTAGQ